MRNKHIYYVVLLLLSLSGFGSIQHGTLAGSMFDLITVPTYNASGYIQDSNLKNFDKFMQSNATLTRNCLEPTNIDVNILMRTRIVPWIYNITDYDNHLASPEMQPIYQIPDGYPELVFSNNMTIYTDQVVNLTIKPTFQSGFTMLADENPGGILTDLDGNPLVDISTPQGSTVEILFQAPSSPQIYQFRAFVNGAGLFGQIGFITVIERPTTLTQNIFR